MNYEKYFNTLNIPRRFRVEPFQTKALEIVLQIVKEKNEGIYILSGKPGIGKTYAVCRGLLIFCYGGEGKSYPRSGVFASIGEVLEAFRKETSLKEKILNVRLLAIDDLGCEYADKNSYNNFIIDEIFNHLYAHSRFCLITTNLTVAQFKSKYSERLVDRVREFGKFIEIEDINYRRKQ